MKSIRRTLLAWLSLGLALGIAAGAWITYTQARDDANDLFDYQMKQIAASLPREASAPMDAVHSGDIDLDEDVLIQIWDKSGVRIFHSHERPSLPRRVTLGFSNVRTDDGLWRVYAALYGDTVVQVAQPVSARQNLAARSAIRSTAPLLALLPLLGLLVWFAVGRGLAPITRVAQELHERDSHALTPLSDAGMPAEIQPLTHALNDLLGRLSHAIEAQRDFVADAAHELRTPLTALTLQLQLLERAGNDAERMAAAADLKHGLERASHLVDQLLTLSRQEHDTEERALQNVDLLVVARAVVTDQAPIAARKNIDLGLVDSLTAGATASMAGDAEALRIMLGCLVDNAIRYTPPGGRVDVSIAGGGKLEVTVTDTGPGIPETEHARVFDRFYRREPDLTAGSGSAGSGLGLAIVKKVVELHSGEIRLGSGRDGCGLSVSVTFNQS